MANATPTPHMTQSQSLPRFVTADIDAAARLFGVPGMALAIVTPDQSYTHLYGVNAPGSDVAVSPDTWFSLASVAKHATAMAVLDLAQSGLVDLAAPVGAVLADLPPSWSGRSIDSLLQHTSGLPEYLGTSGDDVPTSRAAFIGRYGSLEPVFDEGAGWMYSNTNYILLGFLIARLRQRSFSEAVGQMASRVGGGVAIASPQWTRAANEARLGQDARDEESAAREVIGDGDLSMTVLGATSWLRGLLTGQVLTEPWRSKMWEAAELITGRPAPYGCGWFIDRLGQEPIRYHGGHFDGWTAMAYIAPVRGCGVIAMCNLAPRNTRAMRYISQRALEAVSPGATPLGLTPLFDDAPALTAIAKNQLLRNGAGIDERYFSQELIPGSLRGGARGVLDLWSGSAPKEFDLVEQQLKPTHRFRRYRLVYDDRIEHVLVGTTSEGKIFWAWPL